MPSGRKPPSSRNCSWQRIADAVAGNAHAAWPSVVRAVGAADSRLRGGQWPGIAAHQPDAGSNPRWSRTGSAAASGGRNTRCLCGRHASPTPPGSWTADRWFPAPGQRRPRRGRAPRSFAVAASIVGQRQQTGSAEEDRRQAGRGVTWCLGSSGPSSRRSRAAPAMSPIEQGGSAGRGGRSRHLIRARILRASMGAVVNLIAAMECRPAGPPSRP